MREFNPKKCFQPRVSVATAAAMLVLASTVFAASAALEDHRAAGGDLRQVIRLLDKDDNDVVIKAEDLPKTIRDYISKEMPDAKITEARKDYKGNKEKTGDNFTYEVDVKEGKKEYELRFSPDGKLLKKRENAGDDTEDKK